MPVYENIKRQKHLDKLKAEIEALESRKLELAKIIDLVENATSPIKARSAEWDLNGAVADIQEKRVLGDRNRYHVLQMSPRRWAIIKIGCVMAKTHGEYDLIENNLTWEHVNTRIEELNKGTH